MNTNKDYINYNSKSSNQNDTYRSKYYKYSSKNSTFDKDYLYLYNKYNFENQNSTSDIFYQKYCKYKEKYLLLKKHGGALNNIEIGDQPVVLQAGNTYQMKGIITCVGLIIKKVVFNDATGNSDFKDGIAVHFIDGTYFNNNQFTDAGRDVLQIIADYVGQWHQDSDIELTLITRPNMDGQEHESTIQLRVALNNWLRDLKGWANVDTQIQHTAILNNLYTDHSNIRIV